MNRTVIVCTGMISAAFLASPALGFGTVKAPLVSHVGDCEGPQNAEHERITRRALACAEGGNSSACFDPRSLDQIAGKSGSFGAVGAPDVTASAGPLYKPEAHCDGGDYLAAIEGYNALHGRGDAESALTACRSWMRAHLAEAIEDAAALLDDDGAVRRSAVRLRPACNFTLGIKGRAKCNVLEGIGYTLHAAQDFYSHSNWTDVADQARDISIDNPPGLEGAGPAPWLDLAADAPAFPEGLMTGCYGECEGRVAHKALNKDCGTIDPEISDPLTPRGRVADPGGVANFERAVAAAVGETHRVWATFRAMLDAAYGPEKAGRMMCALTRDDPADECE